MISKETRAWLMDAPEPYIRYQAQRLLDPLRAHPALLDGDPFVRENLTILAGWRDDVMTRHNNPGLFMHRLAMLADLGVTRGTEGAGHIVEDLLSNLHPDGSFPISMMIPKVFGGTGEPGRDWVICDFPVTLYALLLMAPGDPRMEPAVRLLAGLAGDGYYPCCGSNPRFKGPGPRGGMCPYANLLVARALSATDVGRRSAAAKLAAGAVLGHWRNRIGKKPFLFGMGTDFLKLKFPMVWYNLLHVVTALRAIEDVADDERFRELATILRNKLDAGGRATAESMYVLYKLQEWSNKKQPSRLLTVLVHRALAEIDGTITV